MAPLAGNDSFIRFVCVFKTMEKECDIFDEIVLAEER